ncbi:MAG: MFS transporter [Polaromonas sp.]|uniref:MFS transporter n=1 Tax=Polaromonas sp. TaxID=1869339 RepID=UPI00272FAA7E|nr:MFS transporter [Polaromonas sp.]MDP2257989.1 MFS transporter [Polaromonas sp.]MDP3709697.1 MFS transporter [Polaromonas sp.]
MAIFDSAALKPGVAKREVFGWAMYDFANSGYTTVVLTAVFNVYFIGVVANGAAWGTLAWTLALSASNLLVLVLMPALGAWADAHAAKRRLLMVATVACVATTAALALTGRGDLWLAVAAIVLSNFFYSVGESLTAAFLPELARHEAMGKVSGWGWSFGYFGGMLSLGLCLAYVLHAQAQGQAATDFVPVTMLITAAVYGAAALVTFALLRERARPQRAAAHAQTSAWAALVGSWQQAQPYTDFRRLLLCAVFYQAGIAVVIALAAVYADQAMKFSQSETMALVFVVNIAAAVGAFAFGYWQDRMGHKRALAATLLVWIGMVLIAAFTETRAMFWLAATLAGLAMGSSQSGGRAMAGTLIPAARLAEFFGLWTFAVRLAAIIGPITYGLVTWLTHNNHRLAILATGSFFVIGLVLLQRVNMQRGTAAGLNPSHDAIN